MLTPDARTAPFTQRRGYDGRPNASHAFTPSVVGSPQPRRRGFTPHVAFDSDDFPMVSGLVESGVGVAHPRAHGAAALPAAAAMLEVMTSRRPA